ncbi:orotidine-5'-phosphate decarboxylase [Bosea sp. CS1GBMeth4]|uniref:orotidine-5'-phosphate decarboxylase n=1 Tax=Bosea sp. CS1GBMeth4 TaxID=1892849 RepID=UPI001645B02D|nr:orotidine-5'-phosphate decarboxylase [Bosea sp. CS1GBMeth4]
MTQKINDLRDRMIVALDVPTIWDAYRIVSTLGDEASFYKIGYRLAFAGGLDLARQLVGEGKKVFLDLKLHDIGNTVTEGVESLTRLGVTFLTVHAYPQTMRGAVEGRGEAALKLLAVTALTSYDDADLKDAGYGLAVRDLVRMRAQQARTAGVDGIVCSAAETGIVRDVIGPDMVIVTPGIRPAGSAAGDQKRTLTPAEAIRAGADHLVVGRPVIRAADPRAAAAAIMDEIAGAA